MSPLYLLDSGPLGLAAHPRESDRTRACKEWLKATLDAGGHVMVPEIADYEVRRELVRIGSTRGIARLDFLAEELGVLPVDRAVWLRAAELWAGARNAGLPTAPASALDGDVILAATAQVAAENGDVVVVITENVGHLGRFVDARAWDAI